VIFKVVGHTKRQLFLQRRANFFRQNVNVWYIHSFPQTPIKFQRRAALQPTTANQTLRKMSWRPT